MVRTVNDAFLDLRNELRQAGVAGFQLEARELIKARVLDNSGYTAKEAASVISEQIDADVVSCVGTKFVLYKESKKKKRIEI